MSDCNCRDDYLPTPPIDPDCPCPPPRPLPPVPGCPPRPCPPDPCQNRTPNYGLPLWKASDVTSWLMQMNGAMLRIDNIMHDLALRTGINGLPDDLVTSVSKVIQDVAVLNCTVGELANKQANQDLLMQNMNTQFSAMKTDIASLQLSITNLDTRVMTVDSANQQNRNDITLIKSDLNMLSKTVTNLSSNMSQFQNATNQTLAALQASVDANKNSIEQIETNMSKIPQYDVITIDSSDLEFVNVNAASNYDKVEFGEWRENAIVAFSKSGIVTIQLPRFVINIKSDGGITDIGWLWIKSKTLTEYYIENNLSVPTYGGMVAIIGSEADILAGNGKSTRVDFVVFNDNDGNRCVGFHINFSGHGTGTLIAGGSSCALAYKENV